MRSRRTAALVSPPHDLIGASAMRLTNRREGFALVAAIGAIVVIAALVAGAFYASTQEFRIGRNSITAQRAFVTAEHGLNQVVAGWQKSWNVLPANTVMPFEYVNSKGDPATVSVTKTNDLTYVVSSEGTATTATGAEVVRRTSQALVIAIPTMYIKGAVTVAGQINVQGSALIVGKDSAPKGWGECPTAKTGMAAIVAKSASDVTTQKTGSLVTDGDQKILVDSMAGKSATYGDFGDVTFDEMAANADLVITGDQVLQPMKIIESGTCKTYDIVTKKKIISNWGDPYRTTPAGPCEPYAPSVYINGNVQLNGTGYGQGILLVSGNLIVNGSFDYYGIIVVKGKFENYGTANITGAVLAGGVIQNSVQGNATINYSSCAIEKMQKATATISLAHERPWSEMY
jgi:Tfp pilus assembly protein PilX